MRIALGIEYTGTHYHGWQRQETVPSIQAIIESAISKIADHPIEIICAGRTDAGVHATGQIVHFDTHSNRQERAWVLGCNTLLPPDIRVTFAKPVNEDFSARFSAMFRRYRYVVYNRSVNSAIFANLATWHYRQLDEHKMQMAANYLLGEHDFTSLRSIECQASTPIKTIQFAKVIRSGDFVILDIQATGFLHHMVRNIMGVLLPIGDGKYPIEWLPRVLHAKNRCAAGVTALPNGLYLVEVGYPEIFDMPKQMIGPAIIQGLI